MDLAAGFEDLAAGRLDSAEQRFRNALLDGDSAVPLEGLAAVASRRGRFDEARALLERVLGLDPGRATAWNSYGEALGNLGRLDAAAEAFRRAVQRDASLYVASYNLGLAARALNRPDAAARHFEQALAVRPDFPDALQALGAVLHAVGRYPAAIRQFQRLAELRPDDPVAHTSLGASRQMLGDLEGALGCYRRAVALAPDYADAHNNLGTVLQGLRRMDEAEASFTRALELAPGHADALAGLAATLDRRGDYQGALETLQPWLDAERASPELNITGAQVYHHLGRHEEGAALLEAMLQRGDLSAGARQRSHFALGDLHDALEHFDSAFEHYARANASKPVRFNRDEYRRDVERLLDVFDADAGPPIPATGLADDRPVFVLGMPRSGTSLVEQILASHPAVAGAGELTDLPRVAMALGDGSATYPDNLRALAPDDLTAAANDYLSVIAGIAPEAARVVDKTPANYLFAGLIQRLFPRARIIHCVRHPLDTALSCFFQNFAGQGIPFSYRLEDIALYLNEYLRVMAHWRDTLPSPMTEVVYEELVTDQERVSRELVAALDLEWDPACLGFHRADRVVATASHAQVRQPMYARSVGRYRRYAGHLETLRSAIDWQRWRDAGFDARIEACSARVDG